MEAFKHLKIGKAPGPTEVYEEMILASGDVRIRVLMENSLRMPSDWATSVAIHIFKGKGDMNHGVHRGVKILEHAMKIVEKVLEMECRNFLMMNDMQFGFMPGKG